MNPFDHDPSPTLGAPSTPHHGAGVPADRTSPSARSRPASPDQPSARDQSPALPSRDPDGFSETASPASFRTPFSKPLARRLNWRLDDIDGGDSDDHDPSGLFTSTLSSKASASSAWGPLASGEPSPKRPRRSRTGIRGRGWSDDEEDEDDDDDDDDVDDYGAPKGWWDRTTTASSSRPSHTVDDGWFAHRDSSPEDTIRIPTVEELLITEEDLERAKQKLPEDEHLDAEQSIERMLGRLESHRLNPSSPTTAAASRSSSSSVAPLTGDADAMTDETLVAAAITLAFNHIPIVTHMTVSTATHAVHGPCLVLRDGAPVIPSFADLVTYCIPGTRITDVRRKFPENEDPWVAFTVNEDKFLQLVPTADHAAAVDTIARTIKGIVPADAGDRVETLAVREKVPEPAAPTVAQPSPTAGADLVALAQAMAAEIAETTAAFQASLDEIRARYAVLMATAAAGSVVDVSPAPQVPDDDVVMEEAVPVDCTVCYAQSVELVIDPCGHRICRKCWDRLAEPKCCPWDRAPGVSVRALSVPES
ncbi:hypothetical protein AMAG_13962 [Allomyces macrogynus ATCC 38327]|uniref:RING-type domain-containing protein n=1 Tax=Allomyces macrogynus (strain ATCC 38327) TaxID=578462 RepID=A0A0L0T2M2_ALLM3|nr:hypothetical protein AMAG_13962 [Allomyces macrogynus ATCC 38327]|eukprot:KNE69098.1 hypothetical protein AMAG_13962 [Allomyces macrogynus ATCC 38327]